VRWPKPAGKKNNIATFMNASPFFAVTSLQEKWYRALGRGAGPALGSKPAELEGVWSLQPHVCFQGSHVGQMQLA